MSAFVRLFNVKYNSHEPETKTNRQNLKIHSMWTRLKKIIMVKIGSAFTKIKKVNIDPVYTRL